MAPKPRSIRLACLHYSRSTEQAYVHWCRACIRWHSRCHPAEMSGPEVKAFLTYLAPERTMVLGLTRLQVRRVVT
ncbi:phage integrase N-terminal SAM-like domain-containing protein [Delftia acidovorans]